MKSDLITSSLDLRLNYIDYIRAIAIILVVSSHNMGPVLQADNGESWKHITLETLDAFQRISVPLFVMVSGALLLKSVIPLRVFIFKRAKKVFLPFLAWSLVLFSIYCVMGTKGPFWVFPNEFMNGQIHSVYWFVYMLFGLYIATPALSRFVNSRDNDSVRFYVLCWLLSTFLLDVMPDQKFEFLFVSKYIGYFLAGYYFSRINELKAWGKKLFVGLLVITTATKICSFIEYSFFIIALQSISAFILIKYISGKIIAVNFIHNFFVFLSRYSYGIYLSHVLIVSLLQRLKLDSFIVNSIISLPVVVAIEIALSVIILKVINMIPVLRRFSGVAY